MIEYQYLRGKTGISLELQHFYLQVLQKKVSSRVNCFLDKPMHRAWNHCWQPSHYTQRVPSRSLFTMQQEGGHTSLVPIA